MFGKLHIVLFTKLVHSISNNSLTLSLKKPPLCCVKNRYLAWGNLLTISHPVPRKDKMRSAVSLVGSVLSSSSQGDLFKKTNQITSKLST